VFFVVVVFYLRETSIAIVARLRCHLSQHILRFLWFPFQSYYFHQSFVIRSSFTYLSCSLFGSLSNRGFWRKSSFVHGNKSFDLGNVSADVDFKCTLWDIFTLRRGTLSCFFFFPSLFFSDKPDFSFSVYRFSYQCLGT
jgi:hypothetical protein